MALAFKPQDEEKTLTAKEAAAQIRAVLSKYEPRWGSEEKGEAESQIARIAKANSVALFGAGISKVHGVSVDLLEFGKEGMRMAKVRIHASGNDGKGLFLGLELLPEGTKKDFIPTTCRAHGFHTLFSEIEKKFFNDFSIAPSGGLRDLGPSEAEHLLALFFAFGRTLGASEQEKVSGFTSHLANAKYNVQFTLHNSPEPLDRILYFVVTPTEQGEKKPFESMEFVVRPGRITLSVQRSIELFGKKRGE